MSLLALEAGELVFSDGTRRPVPVGVGAKTEGEGVRLMKWVRAPGRRIATRRDRFLLRGASWEDVSAALEAIQAKG